MMGRKKGPTRKTNKNNPNCYPRREKLRATLPNPKPLQKTFSIIYTANTKLPTHRTGVSPSSVTTTTHTSAGAGTSASATGLVLLLRDLQPERFQLFRTLPGPPGNPLGTFKPCRDFPRNLPERCRRTLAPEVRSCPRTSLIGTSPENFPRTLFRKQCHGTCPEPP